MVSATVYLLYFATFIHSKSLLARNHLRPVVDIEKRAFRRRSLCSGEESKEGGEQWQVKRERDH